MKTVPKALLVIDVQNDYFPGGKFPLWNACMRHPAQHRFRNCVDAIDTIANCVDAIDTDRFHQAFQ